MPTALIPEGQHLAIMTQLGAIKSPTKGTPGFYAQFKLSQGGQTIGYERWISDNNASYAAEELILCGYKSLRFDELHKGMQIVQPQEVQLSIGHEEYVDKNGQPQKKAVVKFVNAPGFSFGMKTLDQGETVQLFQGYNFDGHLVKAKQELEAKGTATPPAGSDRPPANNPPTPNNPPPYLGGQGYNKGFTADDIPF